MLKQFIDGTSCESSKSATEEIINPATGEVVATAPRGSGDDVDRAVEAAKRAFPTWASTPPKERSEALLEIAKRLEDAIDEFAKLESANAGKPLAHAYGEVQRSADRLRFFAGASRSLTTPATGQYLPGTTSLVRREPVGVAALIAPWNYPLHMAVWKLAPAIAAGNTCVLKPSELTPLTALAFARLTEGVLPAGVLNVMCGAGETAGALLAQHADVRLVSLTGSVVTGRTVARLAADSLKRLHLELGGKAPAVVLSDADPKQVAAGLRVGSFWNSGQDCTAAARVIVASEVFDDVVRELADRAADVLVANPTDPRCEMGPLISRAHRARVMGFVDRAVEG
ncbi:MAG: aldehyde dehydrogenase family protein, partial [Solirubrobacterales bacterium]